MYEIESIIFGSNIRNRSFDFDGFTPFNISLNQKFRFVWLVYVGERLNVYHFLCHVIITQKQIIQKTPN